MTLRTAPPDLTPVRALFPALATSDGGGMPPVFLDNPGGTQVPEPVLAAMRDYLVGANANTGGAFATSERSDAVLAGARRAVADYLNATPAEIVFGANMTSLTFAFSRGLGRLLAPGDEIVTTVLDHDANIAPWLALERERGVVVRTLDVRVPDCTLDLDQLAALLGPKTRLLAIGYASNATGTINDVATATRLAHEVGAWVFVDAVQYAPHGAIDVRALDCDFLVCSAYKFFGPHVGILYGKRALLAEVPTHKVRPQLDEPPYRFETGTLNHEGIAGTAAAIDYLATLGRRFAGDGPQAADRRAAIEAAMAAIRAHELALFERLLSGVEALDGVRVWGIADRARFDQRGPTLAFTWDTMSPRETAAWLGRHGIHAWDGDYYATALMERLGLAPGGAVRLGIAHYNTVDEIDRTLDVLQDAQRESHRSQRHAV
jgi:cysteine desulfurase family protein (TIGR01976 family)